MSQTVTKDVRTKGNVIGQVQVVLYDTLDEMEEQLGDQKILTYVNRSLVIDALDAKRRELTGGASTGVRALMSKLKEDPDLMAKVRELVGEI